MTSEYHDSNLKKSEQEMATWLNAKKEWEAEFERLDREAREGPDIEAALARMRASDLARMKASEVDELKDLPLKDRHCLPQRNPDGTVKKGNTLSVRTGGGRPPKAKEIEYLLRFKRAVSPADFELVARKVLRMALNGHYRAIRLLFSYAIGKPTQRIEADVFQRSLNVNLMEAIDKVYGPEDCIDADR